MPNDPEPDFMIGQDGLMQMYRVLLNDWKHCENRLLEEKDESLRQFWARTYVRTVVALIEGACEFFKSRALDQERLKMADGDKIREARFTLLGGGLPSINENGEVQIQPLRVGFLSNMLFSLRSYQEAHNVKHRTAKGDKWHRVLNALNVRHRITHPKNVDGLTITVDELEDVDFLFRWFHHEVIVVLKEMGHGGDMVNPP
jgi:hypothetical protein